MSDSEQGFGFSRRRVLELTGGTAAAASVGGAAAGDDGSTDGEATLTFDEPTRLNDPSQYGYEPSVDVDRYGNIYATAHKSSVVAEGDRISSFFWYSSDGGETWNDMPSPQQVDNLQYALEGDIALDGEDRVYYVDTYAAENHLNRWLTEPSGPVWDYSKPVQQATAVDDRPWLNAHGDGIVYYLGNNGVGVPAPNDEPGDSSRIWFYRSSDGGLTFTPGFGLPTTGYCSIAADKSAPSDAKLDGKKLYLGTDNEGFLELFWSTNAGQDFVYDGKDHENNPIYEYKQASNDPFSTWAVTDRAGNPYVVSTDDAPDDDAPPLVPGFDGEPGPGNPGELLVVRGSADDFQDSTTDSPGRWQQRWEVLTTNHDDEYANLPDLTAEHGVETFTKPWVGAGSEGTLAVVFYGSPESGPGNRPWHTYALVTPNAQADDPDWFFEQVTDFPVSEALEPEDFFECAVGPDDEVHITYARVLDSAGLLSNPTKTYRNNLFHVKGRVEGFDGGDGGGGTATPTDTATTTPTDTATPTPTATPDSFTVSGSRSDDGSVFTGGQANTVTLNVKANERAVVRDPIPDGWELVGNDGEVVTENGQRYVHLGQVPPRGDGEDPVTLNYIVEAPSGVGETGRYTFGPAEADSVAAPENWKEFGGSDTNNVVGADQNDA